jgi:hypothetical protein
MVSIGKIKQEEEQRINSGSNCHGQSLTKRGLEIERMKERDKEYESER